LTTINVINELPPKILEEEKEKMEMLCISLKTFLNDLKQYTVDNNNYKKVVDLPVYDYEKQKDLNIGATFNSNETGSTDNVIAVERNANETVSFDFIKCDLLIGFLSNSYTVVYR